MKTSSKLDGINISGKEGSTTISPMLPGERNASTTGGDATYIDIVFITTAMVYGIILVIVFLWKKDTICKVCILCC